MNQNRTFSLSVLAACFGWTLATAFEDVSRPYLATVGAGTVLVAAGFRTVDASRFRWFAAGETAAVIAVPVAAFAAASVFGSLDESSLLAGIFAAFLVWLISAITLTDIEAVTEPTDLVEGLSGALGRITARLLLVGMGLMIAVVAGNGGLSPVTTARPIRSGLVAPFVLYWVAGLSGLASLNRSRLLARWQRDRYRVDDDLVPRWRGSILSWLSAATAGGLIWFHVGRPLLDIGHSVVASGLRVVTDLVGRLLGLDLPTASPAASAPVTPAPPPTTDVNPITPPSEWFDLFLLVVAGAIFAFAFVVWGSRLRAAGSPVRSVLWAALKTVLTALWVMLRELGLIVLSVLRRRSPGGTRTDRGDRRRPHPAPAWSPTDPLRRRVATEYRAFLSAAAARMGPLQPAETPSELARRIGGGEAASSPVGLLTGIYELARFSEDRLDESMVRQAQEARAEIIVRWADPDGR